MTAFLVVNFNLACLVISVPVQQMVTPIKKLNSLSAGELKNISQADCPPLTVSVHSSLLSWSQLIDLSRHGPSFIFLGLFQSTMTKITFELRLVNFEGMGALCCSFWGKDVDINTVVSFRDSNCEAVSAEIAGYLS